MRRASFSSWTCAAVCIAAALVGCAGGPPPPDWQSNAKSAMDHAVSAALTGDSRAEAAAFKAARTEVASTGRIDWLARAELMRCAAHVASLDFAPCAGFAALKPDADAAEQAYARYLAAQSMSKGEIERLPEAQRAAASALAGGSVTLSALQDIADPLSRLIAIAVLFEAGQASPSMIALASDTASAQGWRRPLLAWLTVQAQLARKAGDMAEADRLQRRIELAQSTR